MWRRPEQHQRQSADSVSVALYSSRFRTNEFESRHVLRLIHLDDRQALGDRRRRISEGGQTRCTCVWFDQLQLRHRIAVDRDRVIAQPSAAGHSEDLRYV